MASGPLVGKREASSRLSVLLCERCGAVLPATSADDHMLRRLAQLSRFGIGAESTPILVDSKSEQ